MKTTSYIENLIEAHMFLMQRQLSGSGSGLDIYHYVDEPGETTDWIVARIYDLLGRRRPRFRLPRTVAAAAAILGDAASAATGIDMPITSARVRKFCTATNFSGERIRALGFVQPVDNETALRKTVAWYLDRRNDLRSP